MRDVDENLTFYDSKYSKEMEYWENKIAENLVKTNLLYNSLSLEKHMNCKEKVSFKLKNDTCERVLKLGKESNLAIYIILLTTVKVMIYKYTQDRNIAIISPVYNENITGNTINNFVPIISKIEDTMSFKNILMEVRTNTIEAYENQDYTINKISESLKDFNEERISKLTNTFCLLKNIHNEWIDEQIADNIVFQFERDNELIKGNILYNPNIHDSKIIEFLHEHFNNILDSVLQNTDIQIYKIPMLSSKEVRERIFEFNDTKTQYPKDKTILQLFEEQVEVIPEQIAIEFGSNKICYRKLNTRANQLASLLRKKGIKNDSIVAIIMENTPELVISILAVMKAGGIYVPIDPGYSDKRILYILNDCNANMVILKNNMQEDVTAISFKKLNGFNGELLVLNELDKVLVNENDKNQKVIRQPDDIVYIIYTSGTTGKPKGAMITEQGLVNYVYWAKKVYLGSELLNFPLYSSISFDLTVTSLFTPLVSGSRIVIYNNKDKVLLIRKIVEENKVGVIKLTPTHLKLIKDMNFTNSSLKKIIVGGEELNSNLATEIYKSFNGKIDIFNEYGPTETVVGCMIHKYNYEKDKGYSVPIGVPADNVQIYILDSYLNPVPVGGCGEIYISGDGVAKGYINQAEKTMDKFVSNVFISGTKMYKSGDYARILSNGEIRFLGRTDNQVKIRGYRIEVEEIEKTLLKHNSIKEAFVLPQKNKNEEQYLCAYIVFNKEITLEELRNYFLEELPEYMLPQYFIKIKEVPLTTNGKVDKKRLIEEIDYMKSVEYKKPGTEIEKGLADIWKKVLAVDRVGINDNFFDVGGNSMLLVQMHSEIEKQYNLSISITDIFLYPTIGDLAKYIENYKVNYESSNIKNDNNNMDNDELIKMFEEIESGKISIDQVIKNINKG